MYIRPIHHCAAIRWEAARFFDPSGMTGTRGAADTDPEQVLGRAVAAGGGEITRRLVAPGAVEGVLHDRQQLDVGNTQRLEVGDLLDDALKGTGMGDPGGGIAGEAAGSGAPP